MLLVFNVMNFRLCIDLATQPVLNGSGEMVNTQYDRDSGTWTAQSVEHTGAIAQADTEDEAVQIVQEIVDNWREMGVVE